MMIGTSFGIFYPTLRRPDTIAEGDLRDVQIRARRRRDLIMLREYIPEMGEILALKDSDYQFRAYCTRAQLARALTTLALEMDYTAFKHTPEIRHNDKALLHVYEGIWGVHLRAFSKGSKYDHTRVRRNTNPPAQPSLWENWERENRQSRDVETVFRTENREWRMSGASPEDLAHLMREIDAATAGVEVPSDKDIDAWLNDHSKCTHADSRHARRRCRSRRMSEGA